MLARSHQKKKKNKEKNTAQISHMFRVNLTVNSSPRHYNTERNSYDKTYLRQKISNILKYIFLICI